MCTLMKQIYCTTRFLKAANHFACDRVLIYLFLSLGMKKEKKEHPISGQFMMDMCRWLIVNSILVRICNPK